jgi:hypothetical protein
LRESGAFPRTVNVIAGDVFLELEAPAYGECRIQFTLRESGGFPRTVNVIAGDASLEGVLSGDAQAIHGRSSFVPYK